MRLRSGRKKFGDKTLTEQTINWQAWGLAIRPRTLPAAAAGVVMGSALAWRDGFFRGDATLACLFAALLLQIGSNLANDVFDFERGIDTPERLGPTRVTQAGLLTPSQVKIGMGVVFALAALLGLYLAWLGGWPIILIGIAAIISAIAYTGGRFRLAIMGLGIFLFLSFSDLLQCGDILCARRFVSLRRGGCLCPVGLIITAILVVNNLRDLENDRKAGKHTLAVMLARGARIEYVLCVVSAYFVVPVFDPDKYHSCVFIVDVVVCSVGVENFARGLYTGGTSVNAALGDRADCVCVQRIVLDWRALA